MTTADLVRMANQIAANFSYEDDERAATDVAQHLRSFWTPSMRDAIQLAVRHGDDGLSPVARAAIERLQGG